MLDYYFSGRNITHEATIKNLFDYGDKIMVHVKYETEKD